jgi:SAM-dependent methyltransferase
MKEFMRKLVRSRSKRHRFFQNLRESSRVLDLGCGAGNNGVTLKELHPTVELHGVDIVRDASIPAFYSFGIVDLDREKLPFLDEYFDAIVFTHVIEHLHNSLQLGKEINRVMKKGARMYVETPNWSAVLVPSFGFHREQHNPLNFYDDPTHVKPWSKQGLFEFISQSCNLRVQRIGSTRSWLRIPLDVVIIFVGLLQRNRLFVVSAFWNLYGWCIYGIGSKG